MVHLDEATYPVGNANELMTPFATSHSSNHNPGPIAIAILKDIGWNVDPNYNSVTVVEENPSFSIYPNPASNQLAVYSKQLTVSTCTITDLTGRILFTETISSSETKIDISSLQSGIYFIEVKNANGKSIVKFVKN